MKDECIQAVIQAVGRQMSAPEIKAIEDGIRRELRHMAGDPETLKLSTDERLLEAANRARASFLREKALKARRDALAVLKHAQVEKALETFGSDKITGLRHLLAFHADAKGSVQSVESRADAIQAEAFSQMLGTLEASHPKFFGLLENPDGVRILVRELFGEDTGLPDAKAGAHEFHTVADGLLQRFNRAGGKVGKLEDWGMPHHNSQRRVAAAGQDAWVEKTLPRLNRRRYANEDGSPMNDQQMVDLLRQVWETIATGGINKIEPGAPRGRGMEASAHSEARVLHFRGADDFMAYQEDFGELSLYDVLTNHVRSMADSIALVETLGPNPDHAYRLFRDMAQREAVMADPSRRGKVAKALVGLDNLYNAASGKTLPVADERVARGFDTLRKWLVASRLGSVPVSSLPDEATMRMTAHVNNLDQMQLFRAQLATLDPTNATEKRLAQRAGLGLQSMISTLNRFGDESMRNTLASKLATFQMRVSGNNAITEARRRAFGTTMMSSLGHLVREVDAPAKLDPLDHRILLSKGITDADWQVWRLAELEDWGAPAAESMLTPEAIRRIADADIIGALPEHFAAISKDIAEQTADLAARNAKEASWIQGRIARFDEARGSMDRWVNERAARRDSKNLEAADAMRERIDLLDAQREAAQMQADMEADFNRLAGKDEASAFLREIRAAAAEMGRDANSVVSSAQGLGEKLGARMQRLRQEIRAAQEQVDATADLVVDEAGNVTAVTAAGAIRASHKLDDAQLEMERAKLERDIGVELSKLASADARSAFRETLNGSGRQMRREVSQAVRDAERIGRRYGETKGRLERRVREIENRIAGMERESGRATDADAKAVQKKADAMAGELRAFIERSQDRQARRMAVIGRLQASEGTAVAEEVKRIRSDASTRLLGVVLEETNMAVVEPGARERAALYANLQKGTWKGELMRSVWLFKTTPISMVLRHWERGMSGPDARSRAGYLAAVIASTTVMGMAALQVDELLKGRDLINMNPFEGKAGGRSWVRALLKGGSLGLYGDFLLSEQTQHGQSPTAAMLGPVVGLGEEVLGLTQGNLIQLAQGKDTHAGAELLKFARGMTPLANTWYTKAVTDHLIFNQLQEMVSPGYLDRVRRRAQREFGQLYYWDMGEAAPSRAPDLAAAWE